MPRPYKIGLDYFPLDTDFFMNKKTKSLRRAHDSIGVLAELNLMCRVYRNGYYYKFDDLNELSMDIAEEIASNQLRKVAAGVTETINYLVERGILDEELFKRGIISGVALQEQYVISAYKAKRKIEMDVHCLVDVNDVISKNKVNSEETQVNSEETQVNSEEGTQIKVNKSNSKKNKTSSFNTTTTTLREAIPSDEEILEYFQKKIRWDLDKGATEAFKFKAYNAQRNWDCLPNWQATADLWCMRMGEKIQ